MVRKTVVLPSIRIIQAFETSRWLSSDTLLVVSGKTVTIGIQKSTMSGCFVVVFRRHCLKFARRLFFGPFPVPDFTQQGLLFVERSSQLDLL